MKKLIVLLLVTASCKTSKKENCDAYGQAMVFNPQHIHAKHSNKWECYEFPADTLYIKK